MRRLCCAATRLLQLVFGSLLLYTHSESQFGGVRVKHFVVKVTVPVGDIDVELSDAKMHRVTITASRSPDVKPGDVVRSVNGLPVITMLNEMKKSTSITLELLRM